jgi:hypothetical protein
MQVTLTATVALYQTYRVGGASSVYTRPPYRRPEPEWVSSAKCGVRPGEGYRELKLTARHTTPGFNRDRSRSLG